MKIRKITIPPGWDDPKIWPVEKKNAYILTLPNHGMGLLKSIKKRAYKIREAKHER